MDIVLFAVSCILAFLIRFDFAVPAVYQDQILLLLPVFVLIKVNTAFILKIYNNDYKYFSVPNVLSIFKSLAASNALILLLIYGFPILFKCPKSVVVIDWLLAFVTICGARAFIKSYKRGTLHGTKKNRIRALIIGAGDTGESILRELTSYNHYNYLAVGLIDDDPRKKNMTVHGIKVVGNIANLAQIIRNLNAALLILAIPSASRRQLTSLMKLGKQLNVKVLTVPSLYESNEQTSIINQLRELKCEDILFREQVQWKSDELEEEIRGKRILVTGAGGSIGSELCRQVLKYKPEQLILFERSEFNLFKIDRELRNDFPGQKVFPLIGDVTDFSMTYRVIEVFKPDIIFHAAAYKHVCVMENNPEVAIKNNVVGTANVAKAAMRARVKKFVLISSDKAVNPSSIMGATKRICEEYVRSLAKMNGNLFFGVRFGNVLGSSGSVLQIFKDQIAAGGPLTVTHRETTRYFMTIPEAVHLVLQTVKYAEGGEIFILDMGKPVRIVELAKKVITMSGLKPGEDIEIVYTGLRPGEKLFEELYEENEQLEKTPHKKILRIKNNNHCLDLSRLCRETYILKYYASHQNRDELLEKMKQLIPTFEPTFPEKALNLSQIQSRN